MFAAVSKISLKTSATSGCNFSACCKVFGSARIALDYKYGTMIIDRNHEMSYNAAAYFYLFTLFPASAT